MAALPPTTREQLIDAIKEFDARHRDQREWRDWQDNQSHKFAIEYEGRHYPVKQIISLATGVARNSFSGGETKNQANEYIRAHRLKIVPLRKRNPNWLRDELILALDLYLRLDGVIPDQSSTEIVELSELLNRLGRQIHTERFDRYRNSNGVQMKLGNFRRFDSRFPNSKGLSHGSSKEQEIWDEYAPNPDRCRDTAQTIIRALEDLETSKSLPNENWEYEEAEEGKAVTRVHVARERSRKIVERKKESVLKCTGRLQCEACGFDFYQIYGERGFGFIECHHEKPVSEIQPGEKTRLKDLRLICSNCHRIIHRQRPWLSIYDIQRLLARTPSNSPLQ